MKRSLLTPERHRNVDIEITISSATGVKDNKLKRQWFIGCERGIENDVMQRIESITSPLPTDNCGNNKWTCI